MPQLISPTIEAKRWIYATITADSTLSAALGTRLYESPAPADAVDPFLVLDWYRDPEDVRYNGPLVLYTWVYPRLRLVMRATSLIAGGAANLETLDQRIKLVLDAQTGATTNANLWAYRQGPAKLSPEFDPKTGFQYAMVGGDWHVAVQAKP